MWRPQGAGELYTYLPQSSNDPAFAANDKICKIPNTECNPTYGASVARGSYKFAPGQWNKIKQRLKLNDPSQANGEIELIVDGKSVLAVKGIKMRKTDVGRIRGIQMQSFFGGQLICDWLFNQFLTLFIPGSTTEWATPKDQDVYFTDFSVQVLSTL